MDNSENNQINIPSDKKETSSFLNVFPSSKYFILLILVVLMLAGLVSGLSRREPEVPPIVTVPTKEPEAKISKMMVYGMWKDEKSYIKGYDLGNKKEYLISELPINVKKVNILSPEKILFIGETNDNDHGKNLSVYNLSTKTTKVVYQASTEFGIDDYVLSKDKRYLAIWEVSFDKQANTLQGGKSKVVSLDLSRENSGGNIIYNEVSSKNTPVHYPRAITSNGEIFLDTFLPNSGAGWAFGMSISNFDGTQKSDLSNMKNGTYGTQPSISPDERYLVFSGYEGADGDVLDNGFRKALLKPDTIELLDVQTKERSKLESIPNNNKYPFSYFDRETGKIVFISISDGADTQTYIYTMDNSSSIKINPDTEIYIGNLSNDNILLGKEGTSNSIIGNLGDSYFPPFVSFSMSNTTSNNKTSIQVTDNYMQFITFVDSNYLTNLTEIDTKSDKTLQLQTFSFKPSLAPKREEQQTVPPPEEDEEGTPFCREVVERQCGIPNYKDTKEVVKFRQCAQRIYHQAGKICMDSPLYLYGEKGIDVNVKINTYVYNSDPLYDQDSGYNIKILEDGKMKVGEKIYNRINYDYLTKKMSPPDYGMVVSKEKINNTLNYYSKNLGLNQKETADLIAYAETNIKSPFAFVSFYDQQVSEEILPLEFIPQPDTYINIVFYFKELKTEPVIKPRMPVFKTPPDRFENASSGYTAVEISEIIDK